MSDQSASTTMASRFRGFLPVVVDIETGGFNASTDALLEIAVVLLDCDERGRWRLAETHACHVQAFEGANIEAAALEFNGIVPDHPLRFALPERQALDKVLAPVRTAVKAAGCTRAVMVGHNPAFDMGFLTAAVQRCGYKRNPFHPFTLFDTATLAGLAYGQTVLARAVAAAGLDWDQRDAHSAIYDAERTAALFCTIVNEWAARAPAGSTAGGATDPVAGAAPAGPVAGAPAGPAASAASGPAASAPAPTRPLQESCP